MTEHDVISIFFLLGLASLWNICDFYFVLRFDINIIMEKKMDPGTLLQHRL